jgi:hypothetical protein
MMRNISAPGITMSPVCTLRLATMPVNGARIVVSPSDRSALASRDFASARAASASHRVARHVELTRRECAGLDEPLCSLGLAPCDAKLILRRAHGGCR